MRKGALDQTRSDMKLDESAVIAKLKDGEQYKFLGVQENLKQEDKLVLIKDAVKYAKELDLDLKLSELNPTCRTADGNEVSGKQIGVWAKRAQQQQLRQEITKEKWQGKLLKIRWEDDQLSRSCWSGRDQDQC